MQRVLKMLCRCMLSGIHLLSSTAVDDLFSGIWLKMVLCVITKVSACYLLNVNFQAVFPDDW